MAWLLDDFEMALLGTSLSYMSYLLQVKADLLVLNVVISVSCCPINKPARLKVVTVFSLKGKQTSKI